MDEKPPEIKKQDKFEAGVRKLLKFADDNRNYVVGGVIALVLVAAAIYFRVSQTHRFNQEASSGLAVADSTALLRERYKKYARSSQGPAFAIALSAKLFEEQAEKGEKAVTGMVEDRIALLDEGITVLSESVRRYDTHVFAPRLKTMLAEFQAERDWVEKHGPALVAFRQPREKQVAPKPEKLAAVKVADKPTDNPVVRLRLERGDIVVELFEDQAPNHVANFVSLALEGFYDGLKWHRVEDWVVQTGCPDGTGGGGPGYTIKAEFTGKHERGAFGMARTDLGNDTAGSQVYIVKSPAPNIDGKYTIFGKVLSGMELADQITKDEKLLEVTVEKLRPGPDGKPKKYAPTIMLEAGKKK